MDMLLAVIGFLALGALLIAASVALSALKRYVSGKHAVEEAEALASDFSPFRDYSERPGRDRRRSQGPVVFPITINGRLITQDRRRGERRQSFTEGDDKLHTQSEASSRR